MRRKGSVAEEIVYYRDLDVIVTESAVVIGGTTYLLANAIAARWQAIAPSYSKPMSWLIAGGLLGIIGMMVGFKLLLMAGGVALVIGVMTMRDLKPNYGITLVSTTAEYQRYVTADRVRAEKIVAAINAALAKPI